MEKEGVVVVICPDASKAVVGLTERRPVALMRVLGIRVIERILVNCANRGAKRFKVVVSDRPGEVRRFLGDGQRWGVQIELLPSRSEPSLEDIPTLVPDVVVTSIVVADHVPEYPEIRLRDEVDAWFQVSRKMLESGVGKREVGVIERSPGVWIGANSKVAESARIQGPVWIGSQVWIGEKAQIGPNTILERGVVVDKSASIVGSFVLDHTYIGAMTEVRDSYANGTTLINRGNGSTLEVVDAFLMNDLTKVVVDFGPGEILGRALAFLIFVMTAPFVVALGVLIPSIWRQRKKCLAARPLGLQSQSARRFAYWELGWGPWWFRKWPQLINVARGQFSWVGNPPLSPERAAAFQEEHETLWLHAPIGFFTLARAETGEEEFSEETSVHASFYAATLKSQNRWRIAMQCLFGNKEKVG